MKLSEIIANNRERVGLTLEQLSEKSGLSRSYLSKLENGGMDDQSVSLTTIIKLATGLGITTREILDLLNVTSTRDNHRIPLKTYLRKNFNISDGNDVKIIEDLIDRLTK